MAKKRWIIIAAILLAVLLIRFVPGLIKSVLPVDLSDLPEVHPGENWTDTVQRIGPPTLAYSDVSIWHKENWTLVCAYRNGLEDWHLVDRYCRRIAGSITPENTVLHILNELAARPREEMIQQACWTSSGYPGYGLIGYDGGIVLFGEPGSDWKYIYDYEHINDEQPYSDTFVWSYLLERLFRVW